MKRLFERSRGTRIPDRSEAMTPRTLSHAARTLVVLWLAAFLSGAHGLAVAASTPREMLTEAEALYFNEGRVEEALALVAEILETSGVSPSVAHGASVLEGRIQNKLDRANLATEAFERAFCLDPAWNPTAEEFSRGEMELISLARASKDCGGEGGGGSVTKKWWFWAAAGGAVVGLALALGGGGGNGNGGEELPGFPPPPEGARRKP